MLRSDELTVSSSSREKTGARLSTERTIFGMKEMIKLYLLALATASLMSVVKPESATQHEDPLPASAPVGRASHSSKNAALVEISVNLQIS